MLSRKSNARPPRAGSASPRRGRGRQLRHRAVADERQPGQRPVDDEFIWLAGQRDDVKLHAAIASLAHENRTLFPQFGYQ